MKKIVVLFLVLSLSSCNSQEKKEVAIVNVNVEQFQQLISKKGTQLIDVRTPDEFNAGHIKNATLINFFDADFKEKSLKVLDKNKPVYVYCRSGGRSGQACAIMNQTGFKNAYNLVGGFNEWQGEVAHQD